MIGATCTEPLQIKKEGRDATVDKIKKAAKSRNIIIPKPKRPSRFFGRMLKGSQTRKRSKSAIEQGGGSSTCGVRLP